MTKHFRTSTLRFSQVFPYVVPSLPLANVALPWCRLVPSQVSEQGGTLALAWSHHLQPGLGLGLAGRGHQCLYSVL